MKRTWGVLLLLYACLGVAGAQSVNFSNTTPSAPAGGVNVKWQYDAASPVDISAYTPQLFVVNVQSAAYQAVTADFTACKMIVYSAGSYTVTLVDSTSQPDSGQCIWVENDGTGTITISPSGQLINGSGSSLSLSAGTAAAPTGAFIVSNGTNYDAITFDISAASATTVATTGGSSSASTFYPTFVASNTPGNQAITTTGAFSFSPSAGTLSVQNMVVSGSIIDNTNLSLAQLGIFNPAAMPITTALANPASLDGLATSSIGQVVAQTAHNSSAIRDCITTNISNAYSCTTAPSFTPSAGDTIQVNFNATNTSTATLSVNGASAYPVYKNGGTSLLAPGDLKANHWVSVILDSSNHWQIEGQLGQIIATQVNVTTIVDQTNFPLAQLGIFNPAAIPITTAQPNLASLSGLAMDATGRVIPGMQKYQLTSQYVNATTTPTVIWSFPISASANYHIECRGRYKNASGGAFELTLTGPASPTNVGYTFTPEVNLSANAGTYLDYEVGVANTYPTSINTTAVTAAATDMSFALIIDLNNGTTAGMLSILGNTILTDTLNVEIGSTCIVYPN